MDVARTVLGCGNFGGIGSAPAFFGQGETREQAFAIMDAAWELGIRWFDTADAYGGGRSEAWIGEWIRATGRRPRITTKTFNPVSPGADHGLARERVLRQAASSLERLSIDRIDLYLTHDRDPATPVAETCAAFEELIERGVVARYGLSNTNDADLRAWIAVGTPGLVQNSYSLLERGDEREVIPLCNAHAIEYQAFSPLAGGWLTGKYRRAAPPPTGSRMTLRPEPYRHLEDERVYEALEALGHEAAARGVSATGLALAWALGGTSSIVVGPRRPEHLDPVHEALGLRLTAQERERLTARFARVAPRTHRA